MELIDKTKTALRVNRIETARPFYDKEDIVEQAVAIIDHMPEIDPVHAAGGCYCGECRYWYADACLHEHWAEEFRVLTNPDDFCSYGRRREGAE